MATRSIPLLAELLQTARLRQQNTWLENQVSTNEAESTAARERLLQQVAALVVGFTEDQQTKLQHISTSVGSGNEKAILSVTASSQALEAAFQQADHNRAEIVEIISKGVTKSEHIATEGVKVPDLFTGQILPSLHSHRMSGGWRRRSEVYSPQLKLISLQSCGRSKSTQRRDVRATKTLVHQVISLQVARSGERLMKHVELVHMRDLKKARVDLQAGFASSSRERLRNIDQLAVDSSHLADEQYCVIDTTVGYSSV